MGWLKECPRKYFYHMIEGWSGRGESIHLRWGIHYHEALDLYEKLRHEGATHDAALHEVVATLLRSTWDEGKPWRAAADLPADDKASLKNRENLVRSVVWYLEKFGPNDPAATKVANGRPMVELHFQFELDHSDHIGYPYSLCGYLDRVVDFQGEAFVMDRKTTTSTLGSYYFDQYDPDNQMSFYTLAAEVAFKTPVKGVIVDAAQVAVGFTRFVRSFVFKTYDQLEEWMKDLKIFLAQARMYAEANYWPMNDKSCHKYGGCVFRGICSKSPQIRDKFLESAFEKKVWNPLIPR
jgi:hypothetical protein